MRVLVSIEVGHRDSSGFHPEELCSRFRLDLIRIKFSAESTLSKSRDRLVKMRTFGGWAFYQAWDSIPGKQRAWLCTRQNHVTSNAKLRNGPRNGNSVVKCGAACHQRGRGHNARCCCLQDRAIYPGGEAEIVRVDDETAQVESLTKQGKDG